MSLALNRFFFLSIILSTASLTLWKSSEYNLEQYQAFEWYFGGSMVLHTLLSFLIGFFAASIFVTQSDEPRDPLGIRWLFFLLLLVSGEEFSQLFIANRSFSLSDLTLNWVGLTSGYFVRKLILVFTQR
ncbi:VanZ family protein [Vibrio maerlii]|uniref:VanZ family protein n=1 Tax=Vibrio maerlii TaxID=2231648 RepID=UPI000E3D0156|nr:VanZ family protein [Vibrio maerlii]